MKLNGLHILLTYQCTSECDHCFVWGSPWQNGTLTLNQLREILRQAHTQPSIEWIYFEGGEPFLYYPLLLAGVCEAKARGFQVGVVTNAFWALSLEDAYQWLRPLAGLVDDFSVSCDRYHSSDPCFHLAVSARKAAEELGMPASVISIAQPEVSGVNASFGQLPPDESGVMFRGRAAEKLSGRAAHRPWKEFICCPHENLRDPGRVHVDPYGEVHVCQGISIGNLFQKPLGEICAEYVPEEHPILGALIQGGPAGLVNHFNLPHADTYADACHLCYLMRLALRGRFPEYLRPDPMYGIYS